MKNGELPLRFVRLQDTEEGPRGKVALFVEDASKDYDAGDVIALTETNRLRF